MFVLDYKVCHIRYIIEIKTHTLSIEYRYYHWFRIVLNNYHWQLTKAFNALKHVMFIFQMQIVKFKRSTSRWPKSNTWTRCWSDGQSPYWMTLILQDVRMLVLVLPYHFNTCVQLRRLTTLKLTLGVEMYSNIKYTKITQLNHIGTCMYSKYFTWSMISNPYWPQYIATWGWEITPKAKLDYGDEVYQCVK